MIIVTQNEENIINFDNVINIGIERYDYELDCRDVGTEIDVVLSQARSIIAWFCNKSVILGTYSSQNRAKEVLKEIFQYYDVVQDSIVNHFIENEKLKTFYFEMPQK